MHDNAQRPDYGDNYTHNTRLYTYLKTKGWLIRRLGDGSWMTENGLQTTSGFHTWIDALVFANGVVALLEAAVEHEKAAEQGEDPSIAANITDQRAHRDSKADGAMRKTGS
jgi:hypothetical protein